MVERETVREIFVPFGDTRTPDTGSRARELGQRLRNGHLGNSTILRPQNIPLVAKLPEEQRTGYLLGYHVRVYRRKEKQK